MEPVKSFGLVIVIAVTLLTQSIDRVNSSFIDPQVVYKEWAGWGTSLAWFSDVLGGMPDDVHDEIVDGLFSPDRLNLNIVRYTIGGTTPGNYTCGEYRPGGATESYKDGPATPYNWTRDSRARKVLLAAKALGVDTFEAFSNSPPQWMTKSGCSKGNSGDWPLHENFDPALAELFADYVTEVVKYFHENWGVTFTSIAPFNEPSSGYWTGPSEGQEGCNMRRETMIQVIRSFWLSLGEKDMLNFTSLSVADETELNVELITQRNFTGEGIASLYTKVNTHGYLDFVHEFRSELYTLAQKNGHTLWMDEWGWRVSDDMSQGIIIAERIVTDIRVLNPDAWLYWQVMEDQVDGAWGLVDVPYDNATLSNIRYNNGYYCMLQFSKYIKKGYQIVYTDDKNSVAAYDPTTQTLVLVLVNPSSTVHEFTFDLSRLSSPPEITATVTSNTQQNIDLGEVPLTSDMILSYTSPFFSVTTFILKNIAFDSAPNLLINGDFESPRKEGWTVHPDTNNDGGINGDYVYTGNYSANIDLSLGQFIIQNVTAPSTRRYFLTARASSSGLETGTILGVLINEVEMRKQVDIAPLKGYQPYGISFDATVGDNISVYLSGVAGGNGDAQLDDVILH